MSVATTDSPKTKAVGRPSKKDVSRSARIDFRVTPDEKKMLHDAADAYGISLADYLILKAMPFGGEVVYPPLDELRSVGQELVHQGTNLNQIANGLNRLVRASWVDAITRDDLNSLARELDQLVRECSPSIIAAAKATMALLDASRPKRGV